jgi:hypothetical protein
MGDLLAVLWFFVPAYLANMSPVLVKGRWKRLAVPIDGGRTWRGCRIPGDHYTALWFPVGFLQGLGTGVGDAVQSFCKRRIGIAPGHSWIGFDQLDFIVGAYSFVALVHLPPVTAWLLALPVVLVGGIAVTTVELGARSQGVVHPRQHSGVSETPTAVVRCGRNRPVSAPDIHGSNPLA